MKSKVLKLMYLFVILFVVLIAPNIAFANMAAPDDKDIGTGITFKNNDEISVLNEVLNIKVNGVNANIEAIYTMKNMTDLDVQTDSMFISPNISDEEILVMFADNKVEYSKKEYYMDYDSKIGINDWEYVILKEAESEYYNISVVTIRFTLKFKPKEEAEVSVKYNYRLGGRPSREDNLRYGEIFYYLKPASTWNDFSNLTINLELSDEMPVIDKSNLEFKKIADRTYQYSSATLPDANLDIKIGLTKWQSFILYFKSPYLIFDLTMYGPFILLTLAILTVITIVTVKSVNKKKKS